MTKYFISNHGTKNGPFTLQELRAWPLSKEISNDTLIWFDGIDGWIPASELGFMHAILGIKPPPIPANKIFTGENIHADPVKLRGEFTGDNSERESLDKARKDQTPSSSETILAEKTNDFTLKSVGYNVLKGRVNRLQFWILSIVFVFIEKYLLWENPTLEVEMSALILIAHLVLAVYRCHDLGRSGWFSLIPIYNPVWLLIRRGDIGKNRFGDNP